jgi:hypothetical protein
MQRASTAPHLPAATRFLRHSLSRAQGDKTRAHAFLIGLLIVVLANAAPLHADGVRPQRFGPYVQQSAIALGNPAGYSRIFPIGAYNLQAGWIEPIAALPWPLFRGSYIETQGNATFSPYQTDFGIAFNLKPIRFFEFGLAYNRLFFPNTLAGFDFPDSTNSDILPSRTRWRPPQILGVDHLSAAGADIFSYQANVTVNAGPIQLHGGGSYSMWDVDSRSHDLILEYRSGLLIKKHDRIGSVNAQALVRPDSGIGFFGFTANGLGVRNQLWWTVQTGLSQNMISAGVSGIRRGQNGGRLYRGLDGWVGYWTWHPQLTGQEHWQKLNLSLQWTWNIQILNLTEQ